MGRLVTSLVAALLFVASASAEECEELLALHNDKDDHWGHKTTNYIRQKYAKPLMATDERAATCLWDKAEFPAASAVSWCQLGKPDAVRKAVDRTLEGLCADPAIREEQTRKMNEEWLESLQRSADRMREASEGLRRSEPQPEPTKPAPAKPEPSAYDALGCTTDASGAVRCGGG